MPVLLRLHLLHLLQLLHFNAILQHAEEVLAEIKEDQGCSFDQLYVNHIVGRKFADFSLLQTFSLLKSDALTVAFVGDVPSRFALGLVRLLQNADVKSKELPREKIVDHSFIVEYGLAFQANPALKLAVFAFRHLPVLSK